MFAIVIIGICMSIIASIFPAAISVNQETTSTILGQIISENGLAIAKCQLTVTRSGANNDEFDLTNPTPIPNITTQLVDVTSKMGGADTYPLGEVNHIRGYKVLIRQMTENKNDFMLVIISYTKNQPGNTIEIVQHPLANASANAESFSNAGVFQTNAPVISYEGAWTVITGKVGNNIDLDHPFSETDDVTGMVTIIEKAGGTATDLITPGCQVMVVRTSLREAI